MSLLAALRAATEAEHRHLEAVMALDAPTLDAPRYGKALQVLHAAREGWEPELDTLFPGASGGLHREWLRADLAALGLPPLPPEPGLHPSPAAGWGVRYVLEGSALGGRVIARQVARLGFDAARGARYFAGRGEGTGAHWRGFLVALEEAGQRYGPAPIVEGACRAFAALRRRAEAEMRPAEASDGP